MMTVSALDCSTGLPNLLCSNNRSCGIQVGAGTLCAPTANYKRRFSPCVDALGSISAPRRPPALEFKRPQSHQSVLPHPRA